MKYLLGTVFALFIYVTTWAQTGTLHSQDGIEVTYNMEFDKAKKKNDVYKLEVTVKNTSSTDYYYVVPRVIDKDGVASTAKSTSDIEFAVVSIGNATGIYTQSIHLKTQPSQYLLEDDTQLYVLKAGEVLREKINFNITADRTPEPKITFKRQFRALSGYKLKLTPQLISGEYLSNCDNVKVTLLYKNDPAIGIRLEEFRDGVSQGNWVMKNKNTFVKETNQEYLFRYYQEGNRITYLEPDGKSCVWLRD